MALLSIKYIYIFKKSDVSISSPIFPSTALFPPITLLLVCTYLFFLKVNSVSFGQVLSGLVLNEYKAELAAVPVLKRSQSGRECSGGNSVMGVLDATQIVISLRPGLEPQAGPRALGPQGRAAFWGWGTQGGAHRAGFLPSLCTGCRAFVRAPAR